MKRLPPPARVSAVIVPACSSTIRWQRYRPSPIPPTVPGSVAEPRKRRWKIDWRSSGVSPEPESSTCTTTCESSLRNDTTIAPPCGENLIAFSSRLRSACGNRSRSISALAVPSTAIDTWPGTAVESMTSSMSERRLVSAVVRVAIAPSGCETSSRSSVIPCSRFVSPISATRSVVSGASSPCFVRRSISCARPRMPVSGVRSSCAAAVRKSSLSCVAFRRASTRTALRTSSLRTRNAASWSATVWIADRSSRDSTDGRGANSVSTPKCRVAVLIGAMMIEVAPAVSYSTRFAGSACPASSKSCARCVRKTRVISAVSGS